MPGLSLSGRRRSPCSTWLLFTATATPLESRCAVMAAMSILRELDAQVREFVFAQGLTEPASTLTSTLKMRAREEITVWRRGRPSTAGPARCRKEGHPAVRRASAATPGTGGRPDSGGRRPSGCRRVRRCGRTPAGRRSRRPLHDVHLVRDDQHREVQAVAHGLDQFKDLVGGLRVQGAGRLVAEQHVGVRAQGAGDAHALALPAGKLCRVGIGNWSGPRAPGGRRPWP